MVTATSPLALLGCRRNQTHTHSLHTHGGGPFSFGLASTVRRVAIEVPHRRGRRTNFDLSKRRRIPRIDLSSSGIRRVARAIALACMPEREPRRGALHRWQAGRVCFSMHPSEHSTSDIGQIRHTSQGLRSGTSKPWRPLNGRGETIYSIHTHVLERAGPDTLWNGVWNTLWYT